MILTVGDKVVYPSQGPCLVGRVVKKVIDGRLTKFYRLVVLHNGGGELFIPVDKTEALGLRRLLKKSEIQKLIEQLKKPVTTAKPARSAKNWIQRTRDNLKRMTSGSAFDLADLVEALTESKETRPLSPRENRTLERAKELLICEIAEVTGEGKSTVEARVEQALNRCITVSSAAENPMATG